MDAGAGGEVARWHEPLTEQDVEPGILCLGPAEEAEPLRRFFESAASERRPVPPQRRVHSMAEYVAEVRRRERTPNAALEGVFPADIADSLSNLTGKYTRWTKRLDPDSLAALLWAVGRFSRSWLAAGIRRADSAALRFFPHMMAPPGGLGRAAAPAPPGPALMSRHMIRTSSHSSQERLRLAAKTIVLPHRRWRATTASS